MATGPTNQTLNGRSISDTRQFKRNGFTLVEIMVVMVILSLAASLVVFMLPSSGPTLRDVAEETASRIKLVSTSAIERTSMTGIELSHTGYRFTARQLGAWIDHPGLGRPGTIHEWPEGVEVTLTLEGSDLALAPSLATGSQRAPELYFTPDGLQPPFTLRLINQDNEWHIIGSADGTLAIETPKGAGR